MGINKTREKAIVGAIDYQIPVTQLRGGRKRYRIIESKHRVESYNRIIKSKHRIESYNRIIESNHRAES